MSCSVFQCFGSNSKGQKTKLPYWDGDEPSSPFSTLTKKNQLNEQSYPGEITRKLSFNENSNSSINQRSRSSSVSSQKNKKTKSQLELNSKEPSEQMSAALTSSLNYNGSHQNSRQMFQGSPDMNGMSSAEQRMTASGGFTFTPNTGGNSRIQNPVPVQEPTYVVAKFNYAATESAELSIKKGEKLVVMDSTGDWWRVQNGANKIGKVPSNHVEIIASEESSKFGGSSRGSKKSSSFFKKILGKDKSKKNNSNSNISKTPQGGNQPGLSSNGAMSFNYLQPIGGSGSNGYNRDENGTFNGYTMSQNPVSFGASPLAASKLDSPLGSSGLSPSALSSNPETAIAIYNYQAVQADELNLSKGDQVTVLQKSTDGWWQVFCNGKTGWIPSNYLNVNTTAAALNASASPQSNQASSSQPFDSNLNSSSNHEHNQSTSNLGGGRDNTGSLGKPAGDSKVDSAFLFGVVALYRFQAQDLNELTFEQDERLDVIGEPTSDQDWWQARNSQGLMGLIPKKFVKQVADSKPIFRRPNSGGSAAAVANSAMMRSNNSGMAGARSPVAANASNSIVNSIKQESMKGAGGPYKDRDWYYGRITRNDCEKLFEEVGDYGDFIVRESESCVSISVAIFSLAIDSRYCFFQARINYTKKLADSIH